MDFKKRIATILPYLFKIVEGLQVLYSAQMHHLDLKPSNIFVRPEGQEFKAVIADLGFLMPSNALGTSVSKVGDELPLGTRHYRSPEQKDYFDIYANQELRVIDYQ